MKNYRSAFRSFKNGLGLVGFLVAAAVLSGLPGSCRAAQPSVQTRDLTTSAHPHVFVTTSQIERARQRATTLPWAHDIVSTLVANCDSALSAPLQIPEKAGQWSHHYVCKVCGTRLEYTNGKHICPQCHREYKGWPYDEVIAARQHTDNIDAIRDLGLVYAMTSETKYAQRARDLLVAYADRYTSFPIHDYKGGQMQKGARLFAQTLDEAFRTIPLVMGYDCVCNSSALSDADRTHINNDLLRPLAATIARNPMGVSNWQSWHDAALAGIGYCLGDKAMVRTALHGSDGFDFQMSHSVLSDGFWYEGSASYHFYALEACRWTALAAANAGEHLYKNQRFWAMFDAPLYYTFPDGRFPAVNDSDFVPLKAEQELYDMAFAWYGDPRYAEVAGLGKRKSIEALFWGKEQLPKKAAPPMPSRNFAGLGATMLRQGTGANQLATHFDYGPHGGAHGHFDKLGLIFFANGHVACPDPGRLAYGAPLQNEWYKTTLAHNTLVVDGKNQEAAEGSMLMFSEIRGATVVRAACDTAYPGVRMVRTLGLTPGYLLDVFTAESTTQTAHTFDLVYHFYGQQTTDLKLQVLTELLGTGGGYQVLAKLRAAKTDDAWSADYSTSGGTVRQSVLGQPGATVILGDGLSDNPPTTCPLTLIRSSGKSAIYITLLQPLGKESPSVIERLAGKPSEINLRVHTATGIDTWKLTADDVVMNGASGQAAAKL